MVPMPVDRKPTLFPVTFPEQTHFHFVGIGGCGMSGLAEIVHALGYRVTGSDQAPSMATDRLNRLGILIAFDQSMQWLGSAQFLVRSTAIPDHHPEIQYACAHGIPVLSRGLLLAEMMRRRTGIAVAGAHGKTTTTSLMATALNHASQVDPEYDATVVIGGYLHEKKANAYYGKGPYLLAEADESDASFLMMTPAMAIITNIDADHMETYQHDFEKLQQAYLQFIHQIPFYGLAVLCLDDPVIRNLLPEIKRRTLTYGFHPQADLRIEAYTHQQGLRSHFNIHYKNQVDAIVLPLSGRHNAQNAAGVFAAALTLGIPAETIVAALAQFQGVDRRLQWHGYHQLLSGRHIDLFEDYGHHPKELSATLSGLREAFPSRRVVMIFQPHRYSRTRDLFADFAEVLTQPNQVILTPIYAASEDPIPGISSQSLSEYLLKKHGVQVYLAETVHSIHDLLLNLTEDNDLVILQGAGSVGSMAKDLTSLWRQKEDRAASCTNAA